MPAEVDAILGIVRRRTGVDFSRYRLATVERRIANRMISVGVNTFAGYLALIEAQEDEAQHLLSRISIKVSRFYRHPACFDTVRELLPTLASRQLPLRLWSAGCGWGEEPYTLAMLLEEAGLPGTVLATDIDPPALIAAGVGQFPAEAIEALPPELAQKYLVRAGNLFGVAASVRQRVRFARHDLLFASAPLEGQFDLVACRNVLIYLQRDVREEVFGTIQGAVRQQGLLCLGEAEWPTALHGLQLLPCSRKSRVFRVESGS